MIKAVGADLVELAKIKKIGIERFAKKVLSDAELKEFNLISNEARKLTYLGGRFASKEALFKCFKSGDKTANFKDFTILNDANGAPYVISKFLNDMKCHITITHTESLAMAFVILEI
ncbi:holo-ACP synthase [Acholeplasma equifetale]|jgi:holo-[acyl-carrier protein] synthase|uniref:holo-ACP synthase n=1 Tax=Acholeplasma equifetale TaxID=264634 RepID=UPI000551AD8B|nr:holo-ACP synthase [Acholeplasma equifetale]